MSGKDEKGRAVAVRDPGVGGAVGRAFDFKRKTRGLKRCLQNGHASCFIGRDRGAGKQLFG